MEKEIKPKNPLDDKQKDVTKTRNGEWGMGNGEQWSAVIPKNKLESAQYGKVILVPRAHDPFGLRQGSRPLAGTEAGSPRITDFRPLCAASEI